MSYRYGFLVYGSYIDDKTTEALKNYVDEDGNNYPDEAEEVAEQWFTCEYSAGGDEILGWIGKRIDAVDTFNAVPLLELWDSALRVSSDEKRKVHGQIDALPDSIKNALPPTGVYICWADS